MTINVGHRTVHGVFRNTLQSWYRLSGPRRWRRTHTHKRLTVPTAPSSSLPKRNRKSIVSTCSIQCFATFPKVIVWFHNFRTLVHLLTGSSSPYRSYQITMWFSTTIATHCPHTEPQQRCDPSVWPPSICLYVSSMPYLETGAFP